MEFSLFAYIGAAGGVIGAVTGVVGAIIAVRSYNSVKNMKSLDLRMEVKRARTDVHVALDNVKELREEAINSRKAVASATGMFFSGAMEKWQKQWDQDKGSIKNLSSEVPGPDVEYDGLGPKELEAEIVALHRTQRSIDTMTKRYEADLQSDDNRRIQIREDRRARQPNRGSPFDKE